MEANARNVGMVVTKRVCQNTRGVKMEPAVTKERTSATEKLVTYLKKKIEKEY
jgi:hypothetical protein